MGIRIAEKKMEAALLFCQGFHNKKLSWSTATTLSSSWVIHELDAVVRKIIGAEIFNEHHSGPTSAGSGSNAVLHKATEATHNRSHGSSRTCRRRPWGRVGCTVGSIDVSQYFLFLLLPRANAITPGPPSFSSFSYRHSHHPHGHAGGRRLSSPRRCWRPSARSRTSTRRSSPKPTSSPRWT